MKVELGVVLREQCLHVVLRVGPFRTLRLLVFVLRLISQIEVFVLLKVLILYQRLVLLPEVLLSRGWFTSLSRTR